MYYVKIQNDKIIAKGLGPTKSDEHIEITEEIFKQLVHLPANYEMDGEGNIVSVTPAPEPEPEPHLPTIEERLEALEAAMLELVLGGAE